MSDDGFVAISNQLGVCPMPARGTRPTQVRLTADDLAKVETIRVRMGLPTMAAAIRHAIDATALNLPPAPPTRRKTKG